MAHLGDIVVSVPVDWVVRADARERLARWLWRQDAGGDVAWPRADSRMQEPFLRAADDALRCITEPASPRVS